MMIDQPDGPGNPLTSERALRHRRINQRPKRCPDCGLHVQAGNLARHRYRRHVRSYLVGGQ